MSLMPERAATVTSAATIPAAGFTVRARAADSKAGFVLEKRHPGAERVNGTFMRVLDTLLDPVAASGA